MTPDCSITRRSGVGPSPQGPTATMRMVGGTRAGAAQQDSERAVDRPAAARIPDRKDQEHHRQRRWGERACRHYLHRMQNGPPQGLLRVLGQTADHGRHVASQSMGCSSAGAPVEEPRVSLSCSRFAVAGTRRLAATYRYGVSRDDGSRSRLIEHGGRAGGVCASREPAPHAGSVARRRPPWRGCQPGSAPIAGPLAGQAARL